MIWDIVWMYSPKFLWNSSASDIWRSFRCFRIDFSWFSNISWNYCLTSLPLSTLASCSTQCMKNFNFLRICRST